MRKTGTPIYQVKITLKHSKPPIWRRLLISSETTLAQLHGIIQTAMGWYNSHLHMFRIHRNRGRVLPTLAGMGNAAFLRSLSMIQLVHGQ